MKKSLFFFVAILTLLSLSACRSSTDSDDPGKTQAPTTEAANTVSLPLPGPTTFVFTSGASAWRTVMTLDTDGVFEGDFSDSEMGSTGEGYSSGTMYVCSFSGRFVDVEQISDHAYKMRLTDVTTREPSGQTWIQDDILHVASDPYGIDEGTEFILYLPQTPLSELPEDFLLWWPYRFEQADAAKTTLSCYGILNVTTQQGFFTYD